MHSRQSLRHLHKLYMDLEEASDRGGDFAPLDGSEEQIRRVFGDI